MHLQERTFSILETRRVTTLYKVTFLADENCQEDTKNKWSVRFLLFLEYYKVVLGGALILVVTASEFIFFCRPSLLLTRKCDLTEKAWL